ncbi:uncharacterized protein LOC132783997 [Drosophila nasuta]|uniref:uncharacterized protein LOC132783997 n=1 Tax=Drosophila nasuta TaxID=42062 RepID=UPI0014711EAA|nr:uncharacterized protein LOC132783997 [Drosophila nasuta]
MQYLKISKLLFITLVFVNQIYHCSFTECGKNEVLRDGCFESSCYQFLYDGDNCPTKHQIECHCDIGYVRVGGECLTKDKCLPSGSMKIMSKKEAIIRKVRNEKQA